MKNYKIVNSKAVQEKAQRLGYDWRKKEDETHCRIDTVIDPFLFTFAAYESIATCNLNDWNTSDDFQEITQADFLALPEPLIFGDYVKALDEGQFFVAKIDEIESNNYEVMGIIYQASELTKLTPQQIEILELDDDIVIKGDK